MIPLGFPAEDAMRSLRLQPVDVTSRRRGQGQDLEYTQARPSVDLTGLLGNPIGSRVQSYARWLNPNSTDPKERRQAASRLSLTPSLHDYIYSSDVPVLTYATLRGMAHCQTKMVL